MLNLSLANTSVKTPLPLCPWISEARDLVEVRMQGGSTAMPDIFALVLPLSCTVLPWGYLIASVTPVTLSAPIERRRRVILAR